MWVNAPRRVLLCLQPIDFRKQINGLAAHVEVVLKESPLSEQVFVFVNRRRDALKLLTWDRGGFVLVHKRLERGRFRLPRVEGDQVRLSPAELSAILEGLDLTHAKKLTRWNPP